MNSNMEGMGSDITCVGHKKGGCERGRAGGRGATLTATITLVMDTHPRHLHTRYSGMGHTVSAREYGSHASGLDIFGHG